MSHLLVGYSCVHHILSTICPWFSVANYANGSFKNFFLIDFLDWSLLRTGDEDVLAKVVIERCRI